MENISDSDTTATKHETELEYQYSPSKWSKRATADTVIDLHVALAKAASEKAKQRIPYEVIRYGNGKNQLIDFFGTPLPNDSPVLVYVHGGYWQDMDRSISSYLVEPLYKSGIRVAVVGYDLAPNVTFDRIVDEMEELDEFMTSWSVKTGAKDIWYAGHSAGAYLIAAILNRRTENRPLVTNCPIRGMILISGVYYLVPLVHTYINNNLKLTRDDAEQRSLVEINLKNFPDMKFLTVVAEHDSEEFHKQSLNFHKMLHLQNPNAELLTIRETDHFDVVEKLNDEKYELTRKIISLISGN